MRFFSVVRFIPVTCACSWVAGWVPSGFWPRSGPGPNTGVRLVSAGCLPGHIGGPFGRLPGGVALEVALGAAADRERPGRHVAAYDGAAAGHRAVADLDRRDEG